MIRSLNHDGKENESSIRWNGTFETTHFSIVLPFEHFTTKFSSFEDLQW